MADRLRLFRTAQHKVIVLRTVIGRIQQPDLLQQIASHRKQMTDIIVALQQRHTEIRLEMRPKISCAAPVDLVLICIDRIEPRLCLDGLCHLIERIHRQHIIMICKDNKVSFRLPDRFIRIPGNTTVFCKLHIAHTPILCILLFHKCSDRRIGTAVRQHKLQSAVGLLQHRINDFP